MQKGTAFSAGKQEWDRRIIMAISRISNYEIMKNQMSAKFLEYDQNHMITKFSLPHDEQYLYIRFVGREYRISRSTGRVAWSEDHFLTETEADYNEAMTIYDVLCYSKEDCALAGKFCPTIMHFETVMFMLGHVLRRIRECMEEGDEIL